MRLKKKRPNLSRMKAPKANAKWPLAAVPGVLPTLDFKELLVKWRAIKEPAYHLQSPIGRKQQNHSTFPCPARHQWYTNMLAVPINQLQYVVIGGITKKSIRTRPYQDTITNSPGKYKDGRSHSGMWTKKPSLPPSRNPSYLHPIILPF